MDAALAIVPEDVAADDGPVSAVADVDPMLLDRSRSGVAFDQDVIAEARVDPPEPIAIRPDAPDRAPSAVGGTDPPLGASRRSRSRRRRCGRLLRC